MNTIKLILRQLWRNRLFTFLNVLGLAIGISTCLFIFRIVNYELNFDRKHPAKEEIFKVYSHFKSQEDEGDFDAIPFPLPYYLKENSQDAELVVPYYNRYYGVITPTSADKSPVEFLEQENIFATTADYFKMVPYTWLAGSPTNLFRLQHEVVLTASRAKTYFPNLHNQDIIGKTISYDTVQYTVSGIVEDLSYPSTFVGKEFIKVPDQDPNMDNWRMLMNYYQLFVKVKSPQQIRNLEKTINSKLRAMDVEESKKQNSERSIRFSSLSDLHFNPIIQNHSNIKVLYGLIGIAVFLLILASINYINLSTAMVPMRARSIGIRKTLGERGIHLTRNFLVETFVISLVALLFSWPFTKIMELIFQDFLPKEINVYNDQVSILLFIAGLLIIITLCAGIYPSLLINKVKLVDVMKIKTLSNTAVRGLSLRKTLIVFQFIIAQVFLVGTFIIAIQIKHMLKSELGFDKDAIVTMSIPSGRANKAAVDPFVFKQTLAKYPEIDRVSLGHFPMDNSYWGNAIRKYGQDEDKNIFLQFKYVDQDYLDLYQIKLIAGRKLLLSDTSAGIVINEKAMTELGYKKPEEAIGQTVITQEKNMQIVGVIANFHSKDLHQKLNPIVMVVSTQSGPLGHFNIRLGNDPEQWPTAIDRIQREWKKIYPQADFSYRFHDQEIKALYESDMRLSKILNFSTTITLLLSCLGLIGLVTITTAQRAKEIGIRKVLGSTVTGIIGLLSKDYIQLIVISILVSTPVAWWAAHKWLNDITFKIEIQWWLFFIPAVLTLVIAFLTLSFQSIKAARANPVNSLRDE
ncbi:ABC transporter permease [Sphingobacterium sp.]|uniref:ABC transporter permease n=1 Tax=Sphingobacterium sp. TaxID=341027 RepID=UPI0028A5DB0D|nr:ABC transporter permease [Sphingobacterium sp.]